MIAQYSFVSMSAKHVKMRFTLLEMIRNCFFKVMEQGAIRESKNLLQGSAEVNLLWFFSL